MADRLCRCLAVQLELVVVCAGLQVEHDLLQPTGERSLRRGQIRWVDLDPTRGSESDKRRPAVIVSNDGANANRLGRGVVTVVPITSNIERIYPFHVALSAQDTGLTRDSKAQAEQVRSVTVERIGALIGVLSGDDIAALDEALRLHLALWCSPTDRRAGDTSNGSRRAATGCRTAVAVRLFSAPPKRDLTTSEWVLG